MSKTQRWDWAIGLKLEELDDRHLQQAYKLNWDSLCKFDSCRKNCKRILCLACFDRSWIDNESPNTSGYDNYDTTNCEQKRTDLKTFVGLKNLGATCYVNCLLQLWFHNPALRKAIYEWEKHGNSGGSTNEQREDVCASRMIQESSVTNENKDHVTTKRPLEEYQGESNSPAKKKSASDERNGAPSETSKNQNQLLSSTVATTSASSEISTQGSRTRESAKTNPIEQLQLIFARLQFTNKKSIDPFNFIDSLALNAAEQQDAQEFGNLFMEFLEKSFADQKNSFVSKIIQNQFCGQYSYATICDHCKHRSLSDSKFYELDLGIQNIDTLHDSLTEYFRPRILDGKYNCSNCQRAQSAHRKIILKSLPPTLNLQLLRFVYDVQRGTRQKLNSYIIFPEILDMSHFLKETDVGTKTSTLEASSRNNNNYLTYNGSSSKSQSNIYILSAVLIHRGSSPHSGHYIAHIKDRITKDWYKFNDDSVERIGPQLQVSSDGENITIVEDKPQLFKVTDSNTGKTTRLESKSLKSKTAYMLVYQAYDNEALSYPSDHSEKWVLPEHLQTSVAEENSRSDEMFESIEIAKEVDQAIIDTRKNQIRTIYAKLVCRDPADDFEFIDKLWLQRWFTNSSSSAKFAPIDNSHLLCAHAKLDFRKLDQVKCVRSEGADILYKEFGGGPRLQDAMCRECVELEVKLIQFKEKLKEDQKFITSQAKFKLDANYDFADAYIVGKNSYRDWQALVMVQFEKSHPELSTRRRENSSSGNQHSSDEDETNKTDRIPKENHESNRNGDISNSDSDDEAIEKFVFNSDILCEHNQLINDTSAWRIVPKEVWMIFKHYFGNDTSRPLIEHNANTLMCPECKRQEVEQQEIGDVQKRKAVEQKTRLSDLFHNRKRASWCSMLPKDVYFALDRQFLTKWQKFIRNPCNQEQPLAIKNRTNLVCDHVKSLYNYSNSNPVLPECPFVLINADELAGLKEFYPIDIEIKFSIDQDLADKKLKLFLANQKVSPSKNGLPTKQLDNSGDTNFSPHQLANNLREANDDAARIIKKEPGLIKDDEVDLTEIDWSECVVSEPNYCSDCHEMLKQDELKKLLNYESATIYITKVENPNVFGPQNNPNLATNGSGNGTPSASDNCDTENPNISAARNQVLDTGPQIVRDDPDVIIEEQYPFKRRKKIYIEDEANDFVPPGVNKQPQTPNQSSNSILRRTTRRNRNREQAYTIKPDHTLLELKKQIFHRCQVLPVDQRLFRNNVLLDDNSKTMSELKIIPNCSLKLEVDKPISDNIDLIEDEPSSRKSCK